MTKVTAYHTVLQATPPERNVYHDHSDCPDGLRIKPEHKASGTDNRPRCDACIEKG